MVSRRPERGLNEAGVRPAITMLQGQQHKPDQRNDDVHVEDDAGVAGREIVFRHYLVDVPHRGAEKKQRRPKDCRQPRSEVRKAATKATAENPRLAMPTSNWNGLSAQPMKAAAIFPKKT